MLKYPPPPVSLRSNLCLASSSHETFFFRSAVHDPWDVRTEQLFSSGRNTSSRPRRLRMSVEKFISFRTPYKRGYYVTISIDLVFNLLLSLRNRSISMDTTTQQQNLICEDDKVDMCSVSNWIE